MSLAEIQATLRRFLVGEDSGISMAPDLVGGTAPLRRLAIHRRHYLASLTAALEGKFPATAWLIGERRLHAAAESYVHTSPPTRPCIAEYGEGFPGFLDGLLGDEVPFVEAFATLEWHVGHVAVAIDHPEMPEWEWQVAQATARQRGLMLQPGVRYMTFGWPVDRLFDVFLGEVKPESFSMEPEPVWIELRGARGEFRVGRLTRARYAFRSSLLAGHSLEDASDAARLVELSFDLQTELMALFSAHLVSARHSAAVPEPHLAQGIR